MLLVKFLSTQTVLQGFVLILSTLQNCKSSEIRISGISNKNTGEPHHAPNEMLKKTSICGTQNMPTWCLNYHKSNSLRRRRRSDYFPFFIKLRNIGKRTVNTDSTEENQHDDVIWQMRNIGKRNVFILPGHKNVKREFHLGSVRNTGERRDTDLKFIDSIPKARKEEKRFPSRYYWKLARRNPMKFRNIGKRAFPFRNIGKRIPIESFNQFRNVEKRRFRNIGKRGFRNIGKRPRFRSMSFFRNIGKRNQLIQSVETPSTDEHMVKVVELGNKRGDEFSSYSKKGAINCPRYMRKIDCYNNVIAYYIHAMNLMS